MLLFEVVSASTREQNIVSCEYDEGLTVFAHVGEDYQCYIVVNPRRIIYIYDDHDFSLCVTIS